ncbi:EAL domain-containing protein [Aliikangiella marina]|uniref:EAL domain-containing protein n=1 Tax=Aliikangiella marina TaxID=1712262 RepID=A0A545TE99_9GAMM|nr:GGDEF and EAL domain-containing protein [Aliikangiella marina]TQV75548.1 EAL domain-containing protein [Aliikangiella marina]
MSQSPNINLFSSVVEHSTAHIAVINESGTIVYANEAWVKFGLENDAPTSDWIGVNYLSVCRKASNDGDAQCTNILASLELMLNGQGSFPPLEYPCHSPFETRWFLMRAVPIVIENQRYVCIYHERFVGDTELRASKKRLAIAADAGQIGIWELDLKSDTLIWDQWMYRIYGVDEANFVGAYETWVKGVHHEDIGRAEEELKLAINDRIPFDSEFRVVRPNGDIRHVLAKAQIFFDDLGKATQMIGVNIDITERKQAEEKARNLALYDQLTGIPNRTLIQDRLSQLLAASSRTQHFGALLFLDMDHFKLVNDTAGHDVGDELIIQVANRLQTALRESDTIGRFGGDEFIIILSNLSTKETQAVLMARRLCKKLLALLEKPFELSIGLQQIGISIGVTLFRGADKDPSSILRQADLAMYKAKGSGRNTLHFFDPQMQKDLQRRVTVEKVLSNSLNNHEFSVYFQPQIKVDNSIEGAEALIRWKSQALGDISPGEFIPIAEESGMIIEIGKWVLHEACSALEEWSSLGIGNDFKLAVNISANQLFSEEFVTDVQSIISQYSINPRQIKLELTESLLVKNISEAKSKMNQLKEFGISFSLDDFGTGYSSLAYLQRLPLDQLKIDQSFVRDLLDDKNDAEIAKTVVALANSLGLAVIAEGVESEMQRDRLVEFGCHSFQGFLYSPAIDREKFKHFLLDSLKKK